MKGIILAGGKATRLYPATQVVSKQLLPIYDKPMVYYPLSVLMLAGIQDILLISTPEAVPHFKQLLGTGENLGLRIQYQAQLRPRGIAEAFILGEEFVEGEPVALILGDNLFFGHGLTELLTSGLNIVEQDGGAVVFVYRVPDPERYGVAEISTEGQVLSIEEKPEAPRSKYAVTGLYFYDQQVVQIAKDIEPSLRGELEITDVNREYLNKRQLRAELLGRGYAWLDTGTHQSLLEAAQFVATLEHRQSFKIGCIEEIAYRRGYITRDALRSLGHGLEGTEYGLYLCAIAEEG
ncbi:glucose-1-phosphate thymidylyltransferase RfbA [Candidatus Bipolaricaulota bacterium]